MNSDKAAVRKLLDAVKASGRTSLTTPEGKQVCDAYGIAVPKEGVADLLALGRGERGAARRLDGVEHLADCGFVFGHGCLRSVLQMILDSRSAAISPFE